MGLDMAEIVMDVEEEFDINIPENLPEVRTFGDFVRFVTGMLKKLPEPERARTEALAKLDRFFRNRAGLQDVAVDAGTPLAELLPASPERRRAWRALRKSVSSNIKALESPPWTRLFLFVGSVAMGLGVTAGAGWTAARWGPLHPLAPYLSDTAVALAGVLAGLLVLAIVSRVLYRLLSVAVMPSRFPKSYRTVGDLFSAVVPARPGGTDQEVAEHVERKVRKIVCEALDVKPEEVELASDFYADLGAG